MQLLFKWCAEGARLLCVCVSNTVIGYLLPFPFNQINLIFIYVVWLNVNNSSGRVLRIALLLSFFTELFSSSPFGFSTLALLLSLIVLQWFLNNIFTNHSWYVVMITGGISLIGYRLLFFVLLIIAHVFSPKLMAFDIIPWTNITIEALMSALGLTLFYGGTTLILKRFNPKYISVRPRLL